VSFPYHHTGNTFSVAIDGSLFQTDKSNPNWDRIVAAVDSDEVSGEELIALIRPIERIATAVAGRVPNVEVQGGNLLVDGEPVHNVLATRVLEVLEQGFSITRWLRFVENIYANPSQTSQEELYLFLENHDMPIAEDGTFLAYKVVDADYKDLYSHTYDNSIGQTVVLDGGRAACDSDRNRTCSNGLHFCSVSYLSGYGVGSVQPNYHFMVVKVNPADVVSIPSDAGNAKARTWRYEVVGELDPVDIPGIRWAAIDTEFTANIEDDDWDAPDEPEADYPDDYEGLTDREGLGLPDPEIETHLGKLAFSAFKAAVEDCGNFACYARSIGVPPGTVRKWAARFRKFGCAI